MSKKHLNVEAIRNELRGASMFFQPAKPPVEAEATPSAVPDPPTNQPHSEGEQANGRTAAQTHGRTHERAHRRTGERRIVRQSYNVFEDQHQALKRIEARSALAGKKPIAISEMVRRALDEWLQKQR
ncbi:MAG: hypothetical protein BroJett038_26430 [Chloroflexota bacterium]|nr:MAG: hypothetical protein BroJett038_26430 [Chloroflexota bacterium]